MLLSVNVGQACSQTAFLPALGLGLLSLISCKGTPLILCHKRGGRSCMQFSSCSTMPRYTDDRWLAQASHGSCK